MKRFLQSPFFMLLEMTIRISSLLSEVRGVQTDKLVTGGTEYGSRASSGALQGERLVLMQGEPVNDQVRELRVRIPDIPSAFTLEASMGREGLERHIRSLGVNVSVSHEDMMLEENFTLFKEYPEEEAISAEEVADMISNVIQTHLQGCEKAVLFSPAMSALADAVVVALDYPALVWDVSVFETTPPPPFYILQRRHPESARTVCIAYVILADLDVTASAVRHLQRGSWFLGADKFVLAFTARHSVSVTQIASHPILGTTYNTAVAWPIALVEAGLGDAQLARVPAHVRSAFRLAWTCPHCNDGDPQVRLGDTWVQGLGLATGGELYPDVFKNFNGHNFKVVTLQYEPFSCYEKKDSGTILPDHSCVDTRMLNALAASLNFTYEFVEPADGQWGYRLDNGSYTGVIGSVERYDADFSLNIAITVDREEVVDCTIGYHIEPITFGTTKPRPLNQSLALVRPFQPLVWILFFVVLALSGPLYRLLCLGAAHNTGVGRGKSFPTPSLAVAILKLFGASFSQGFRWTVPAIPRMFVMSWVLFALVTTTMYVAMLTASLTLPTLSPTLNTLEELVKSDFSWGIQDLGAADYQLLKSSKVPLYQEVFRGLDVCPTLDECIQRARDTKYAFITWRTYLEDRIAVKFTSASGERQLHVATGDIFPVELGWAMNPGSPYREPFNRIIRDLLQAGLITKWLTDLINDPKRREASAGEDILPTRGGPTALGINHVQGVFFLLLCGCFLSGIAFLVEVTMGRQAKEYTTNRSVSPTSW